MAGQLHHMLGIKADYVLGSGKQKETQSGKDHIEIGYSFSKLCPPSNVFLLIILVFHSAHPLQIACKIINSSVDHSID